MEFYLGIDIGTSAVKLIAADEDGTVVTRCERSYEYSQPRPGWKEIWPEVWVEAVEGGLKELLSVLDRSRVKAIGFTGQMHTTVFLDKEGACIRPAIMWNDMRTKDRIPSVKMLLTEEDTRSIARIFSTGSPAANLLWLKEEESESFQRLDKFLIGPDYLVYYFSGKYSTDYCEASTSSLYDTEKRCWSKTMRNLLSLPGHIYPPVRGSQEVVGCLREELGRRFGLKAGVKIIAGTGDNPAAAVALGALKSRIPVLSIGTSGVLVLCRERADGQAKGKQILFSLDGKEMNFLIQGVVQSAGGSYHWYVKNILGMEDFGPLTESVDLEKTGEKELLFYPHLSGDKTIYGDPAIRGAFVGLDTDDKREDLAVAVMEGVCFAIKQLVQEMRLSREELGKLKVTGGGAYSRIWMQILADVLNVEIGRLDGREGASYGAALMAKAALHPELQTPEKEQPVKLQGSFTPRPRHVGLYEMKYRKYLKIYDALKLIYQ